MAIDDPDLASTERILQRWAVAVAGGVPDLRAKDNVTGPPPLWPELTVYVDRDYLRAPPRLRHVVKLLYRRHMTYEQAAAEIGCSRQKVYVIEREALWYFRGTFAANGILARFEQRAARSRRQQERADQQAAALAAQGKGSRAPARAARAIPPPTEHGTTSTSGSDASSSSTPTTSTSGATGAPLSEATPHPQVPDPVGAHADETPESARSEA